MTSAQDSNRKRLDRVGRKLLADWFGRLRESSADFADSTESSDSNSASRFGVERSPARLGLALLADRLIFRLTSGRKIDQLRWIIPERAPTSALFDAISTEARSTIDRSLDALFDAWLDEVGPIGAADHADSRYGRASSNSPSIVDQAFEVFTPLVERRRRGEFFTPAWLADRTIDSNYGIEQDVDESDRRDRRERETRLDRSNRLIDREATEWNDDQTWIDPCVGVGAFASALRRLRRRSSNSVRTPRSPDDRPLRFVGVDANPSSVVAAVAAWLIGETEDGGGNTVVDPFIPFVVGDSLSDSLIDDVVSAVGANFDRVIGNPPWIVWDKLGTDDRAGRRDEWIRYGFFTERGMKSVLGGGKKDLSMLVTYRSLDRWLKPGGRLDFIVTQSLFRSLGAGRGFRRFELPDRTPIQALGVDDYSALRPFAGAETKTCVVRLRKGAPTVYPISYRRYQATTEPKRLQVEYGSAEPVDSSDRSSSWRIVMPGRSGSASSRVESIDRSPDDSIDARLFDRSVDRMIGRCDYVARLGVNTGGANGVFWFRRLAVLSQAEWLMANMADSGKKQVVREEVILEPKYLYPIVLGNRLRAYSAKPEAWILMVQDPIARIGVAIDRLSASAPRTFAYLERHRSILEGRALFKKYYGRTSNRPSTSVEPQKSSAPFYSLFNVGPYSLATHKVAWMRMGSTTHAAVVGVSEGKPIFVQETHGMIDCESENEALYLAAVLNSRVVASALGEIGQTAGKSHATPGRIHQLRLTKFSPNCEDHVRLAELAYHVSVRIAGDAKIDSSDPFCPLLQIDRLISTYYGTLAD